MRSTHPQANNLLSRLFSYTPRKGREPIEDFCTETLAWCLDNSADFRKSFFAFIGKLECGGEIEVDTQKTYEIEEEGEDESKENIPESSAGRFDLRILPRTGKEFVIVVESKVWSKFSDQLERYRKELKTFDYNEYHKKILVTLTPHAIGPAESDFHVQWSRITTALSQVAGDSLPQQICRQFADFLKEKGLGPMTLRKLDEELFEHSDRVLPYLAEFGTILMALRKDPDVASIMKRNRQPFLEFEKTKQLSWWYIWWSNHPHWFGAGIIFDHLDKKVLMYSDLSLTGNFLPGVERLPTILRGRFDMAKQHFRRKDWPIANFNELNPDGNTSFFFIQQIDSDYDGKPDKICDWLRSTICAADAFAKDLLNQKTSDKHD